MLHIKVNVGEVSFSIPTSFVKQGVTKEFTNLV